MKGTAYLLQGTLVLIWWLGLYLSQSFYDAFQFPDTSPTSFNALFAPDVIIVALLSIIRGYKPIRELEYIILGGFAYGALFCINTTLITNGGYLPTTIMTLGLCYNLFLVYEGLLFRESAATSALINTIKTAVQIICVWSITLGVFPLIILSAFDTEIIPDTSISTFPIGITLILLFSLLGLYSAYSLVRFGSGTPLPLDQTKRLVISGCYKFVRNPMAIAGVGQGIAISIIYLSIPLFFYSLLGAVMWHVTVRPIEEKNMSLRFGSAYDEYQKTVRCWIPKLSK